jgi:FkbM family methyltransferase
MSLTRRFQIHFRLLLVNISLFKNWWQIYLDHLLNRKLQSLRLWNGLVFYAPYPSIYKQTISIIKEIYQDKVYGMIDLPKDRAVVVFDVGAYIGTFSLMLAKAYPNATIHAFEPEPANYQYLVKNIRENGMSNIIPHNSAVVGRAPEGGKVTLYVRGEGFGTNSLHTPHKGVPVEVPSTTLHDFMENAGIAECNLLKLDCEGSEIEIMETMPANVRFTLVEWPRNVEKRSFPFPFRYAGRMK